jgi:hypothetical protein
MQPDRPHARLRAQLNLALLGDRDCARTTARLEREARSAGLTGAEIDAAIAGRSFEATSVAAISFARALQSGDAEKIGETRCRALEVGLSDRELSAVVRHAKRIVARRSGKRPPGRSLRGEDLR